MRLIYLAVPFVAVLLTACGDDERDVDSYNESVPATGNEYNLPDEPAPMPSAPAATTPPPVDEGDGLDRDNGANTNELTEPDTVQGTGAIH